MDRERRGQWQQNIQFPTARLLQRLQHTPVAQLSDRQGGTDAVAEVSQQDCRESRGCESCWQGDEIQQFCTVAHTELYPLAKMSHPIGKLRAGHKERDEVEHGLREMGV